MIGRDRFINRPKKPQTVPHTRPAKAEPAKQGKPTVVGVEQVKCVCGHEMPLELFAEGKDKYRNERRNKIAVKPCNECRRKAEEEQKEAAKQRRADRKREMFRLPDGSQFHIEPFDAAQGLWTASLVTTDRPDRPFGPISSKGIHSVLFRLGQMWLKWNKEQQVAVNKVPDCTPSDGELQ